MIPLFTRRLVQGMKQNSAFKSGTESVVYEENPTADISCIIHVYNYL